MSNQGFLNSIKNGCINAWHKYKVLPSLVAAQAILESNWGRSGLALKDNNLFGIKADRSWGGAKSLWPTREYGNGSSYMTKAYFRSYPSQNASVLDHGKFLNDNPRYKAVLGETDYIQATIKIRKAGYATDPSYADLLQRIIVANDLYKWDAIALNGQATTPHQVSKYTSIVDFLNDKRVDSSYYNRSKLAAKHGIKNYQGTAAQNMSLLKILSKVYK